MKSREDFRDDVYEWAANLLPRGYQHLDQAVKLLADRGDPALGLKACRALEGVALLTKHYDAQRCEVYLAGYLLAEGLTVPGTKRMRQYWDMIPQAEHPHLHVRVYAEEIHEACAGLDGIKIPADPYWTVQSAAYATAIARMDEALARYSFAGPDERLDGPSLWEDESSATLTLMPQGGRPYVRDALHELAAGLRQTFTPGQPAWALEKIFTGTLAKVESRAVELSAGVVSTPAADFKRAVTPAPSATPAPQHAPPAGWQQQYYYGKPKAPVARVPVARHKYTGLPLKG